jgi:hypothetical protein
MQTCKDDAARYLAESHASIESTITEIIRIMSPNETSESEPIKLLEVNTLTTPSGVMPVSFGPAPDVSFSSVVVDVTPDEFKKIQTEELRLPKGWTLGEVIFKRSA